MKIGGRVKLSISYKKELCKLVNRAGFDTDQRLHYIYSQRDKDWLRGMVIAHGSEVGVVASSQRYEDGFIKVMFGSEPWWLMAHGLVVSRDDATNTYATKRSPLWNDHRFGTTNRN